MLHTRSRILLLFAVFLSGLSTARADMMADSPVTFPKRGALPSKFPPDRPSKDRVTPEKGYYLFGTPERSLDQIARIQKEMPRGQFSALRCDRKHLERTFRILAEGGELNLTAVGDSIMNDTMRSAWVAKLQEAYPGANIHATVYVRGGGGCQHFKEENRVAKQIVTLKPHLVFIGGISQKDIESIRAVVRQLRADLPEVEILLASGVFGTTDPRDPAALSKARHSGTSEYGASLEKLAAEERCAYLDMTTPWAEYLRSSNEHPHRFYRDPVHANAYGEQVLSKILMAYWLPEAMQKESPCASDHWLQWRGPESAGSSDSGASVDRWTTTENLAWKIELPGRGCSTPIVCKNRIVLTSPLGDQDGVVCFDPAGKGQWQTPLGPGRSGKHRNGSSCCPSPVSDGRLLFVYYRSGRLACLDLDGKCLWQTNIQERFGEDQLWWDLGTSPVLTEDCVVIAVMHGGESFLAAFDKRSGELIWKESRNFDCPLEGDHAYTTPLVIGRQAQQRIVVWGAEHVTAHRAADGKRIWTCGGFNPERIPNWPAVASPVVSGNITIVPYGRGTQLAGIELGGKGEVTATHRIWTRRVTGGLVPTPAVHDGKVFVLSDRGEILCIDPKTGVTLWSDALPKHRAKYYSSPTIVGDRLYAAREDGPVFVVDIADGFQLIAENAMDEQIIASPVPMPDGLLLRGERHLFCIEPLGKKGG